MQIKLEKRQDSARTAIMINQKMVPQTEMRNLKVHVAQVSLLLLEDQRPTMSFESYVTAKSSEKQACEFHSKKKAPQKADNVEVTINIGLKRFNEEDLKTIRGKHLPIAVPANETYATILEKAVAKWKAFDRRFESTKEYDLLYEDGTHALFMPDRSFKAITYGV